MADLAVGLAVGDELQYFGGKAIRLNALAGSPTEHDASLASRGDTGAVATGRPWPMTDRSEQLMPQSLQYLLRR